MAFLHELENGTVCQQWFEVRSLYIAKRLHHRSLSTKTQVPQYQETCGQPRQSFSPLVYHFLSQLDTSTEVSMHHSNTSFMWYIMQVKKYFQGGMQFILRVVKIIFNQAKNIYEGGMRYTFNVRITNSVNFQVRHKLLYQTSVSYGSLQLSRYQLATYHFTDVLQTMCSFTACGCTYANLIDILT